MNTFVIVATVALGLTTLAAGNTNDAPVVTANTAHVLTVSGAAGTLA